ncbi:MAG: FAD-binding oxidoreductase, partial [Vampirovibrionales bacterium]
MVSIPFLPKAWQAPPTPLARVYHELVKLLGHGRVLTHRAETRVYACDASVLFPHEPEIVVLPETSEEVQQVVQCCYAHEVSFTARGAGTGQSGGALTPEGGVLMVLTRLNRILELCPE